MSNFARNQYGSGKAVTFNVITPMKRAGACSVKFLLWFFDTFKWSQKSAQELSFLPFVHWVVIKRNQYIIPNPVESDHAYSAYPGASVRDVRAACELYDQVVAFADASKDLDPAQFEREYNRLLIRVQDKLGAFGTFPDAAT